MSSSSAPVARKRPQWMLDEMAADPSLAASLDAARAAAEKVAVEKAARDAKLAADCKAWHASKPAWVVQMVEIAPGVKGNEREWEVAPKIGPRTVRTMQRARSAGSRKQKLQITPVFSNTRTLFACG